MRFTATKQIREMLARKPFHSFRIVTRSGKRYEIVDRDKIAVTKTRVFAFLPNMVRISADEIELVYEPPVTVELEESRAALRDASLILRMVANA
jgi:hypothetical protein